MTIENVFRWLATSVNAGEAGQKGHLGRKRLWGLPRPGPKNKSANLSIGAPEILFWLGLVSCGYQVCENSHALHNISAIVV